MALLEKDLVKVLRSQHKEIESPPLNKDRIVHWIAVLCEDMKSQTKLVGLSRKFTLNISQVKSSEVILERDGDAKLKRQKTLIRNALYT